MAIKGPPVVIVESGGVPITPVLTGAPLISPVGSGGVPVTITTGATPFIIDGGVPVANAVTVDGINVTHESVIVTHGG